MTPTRPEPGTISAADAAKLLGLTPERLRQLAREGAIPKAGRGRYPLVAVVQGYIRFLLDPERRAVRTADATGLANARRREVELRIAEREARLIETEDVEAAFAHLMRVYREETSDIGATVRGRDPAIATALIAGVEAAASRAERRFAEAVAKIKRGVDPLAPGGVDPDNEV